MLECRVFLETDEVGLWAYNASKKIFFKELPDYPIEGELDVRMFCKGKNGVSAKLTVKIKDQADDSLECVINEGNSETSKSITIIQTTDL